MLSFTGALNVYLDAQPQDMRKNFNGLSALVSEHLQLDSYRGALYVFTNRTHTCIKNPPQGR